MKILYYLEPWIELDFPHFRMGTIKNHLGKEAEVLIQNDCDVGLLCRDDVARAALDGEFLSDDVRLFTLTLDDLTKVAPNYLQASKWALSFSDNPKYVDEFSELLINACCDFKPDVLIAYETSASQMLRAIFPESLVIDSTLGSLSREPYPETFCYDPFGSFSHSSLRRFDIDRLTENVSDAEVGKFIEPIRAHYKSALVCASPFRRSEVRRKFQRVLLLPLQVSNYFAFDSFLPLGVQFNSQLEYLIWVLQSVPDDIGVYVTEHGFSPVVTDKNFLWLKKTFPNFIYDKSHRDIKWASQYLLDQVDGVITVSSSLGYQAALYNKYLYVIGSSHLVSLADDVFDGELRFDKLDAPRDKSREMYFVLAKYNPLFKTHVLQTDWLFRFLRSAYTLNKTNDLDERIFEYIDAPEILCKQIINSAKISAASPKSRGSKDVVTKEKYFPCDDVSIKKKIDKATVVSFDLFDTLLVRNYVNPKDVARNVAFLASRQLKEWSYSLNPSDYLDLRAKSAARLLNRGRELGREDVSLREIYNELRKALQITKEQAGALRKIENEVEFRSIRRRKDYYAMYQYALDRDKTIIFLSDMYLDKDFVLHLLAKNGYGSGGQLYLSSDLGKRKKTGKLYEQLLADFDLPPTKVFHIGDDHAIDYIKSREYGIQSKHISKIADILYSSNYRLDAYSKFSKNTWSSVQAGISARLIEERGIGRQLNDSLVAGNPFLLGAVCGGPIMMSFAQWIYDDLRSKNVKKVFFLARDGWYPKKVFDLLMEKSESRIRSEYLLASRKSVLGAALYTVEDILETLNSGFSNCTAEFFLEHRFDFYNGVDYVSDDLFKFGLEACSTVDSKDEESVAKLRKLLKAYAPKILKKSLIAREAYIAYLRSLGFDSDSVAIVDIGHNGTLQRGLGRLLDKKIHGCYFATFSRAKRLLKEGHSVSSFLLEYENNKKSKHYYCRNIGMFEFLFIPNKKSFSSMRVCDSDGSFEPKFVDADESNRMKVAGQVEAGIESFCKEFIRTFDNTIDLYRGDIEDVMSPFRSYIERPSNGDVKILKGVSFADGFGGKKARYLLDPRLFESKLDGCSDIERNEIHKASWWRAGATAILNQSSTKEYKLQLSFRERLWRPFFRPFVKALANDRNNRQFEIAPRLFFTDLNNKYYRRIGRFFFGIQSKH